MYYIIEAGNKTIGKGGTYIFLACAEQNKHRRKHIELKGGVRSE